MKWVWGFTIILSFALPAFSKEIRESKKVVFDQQFYRKSAQSALTQFQKDSFKSSDLSLDVIFLKIEKKMIYQTLKAHELQYFDFQNLTSSVVHYLNELKSNYRLPFDYKMRAAMQMSFYGLSQAIKRGNELNLKIQSDQFDKLHDILVSQSTSLFYASFKEKRSVDLFWTAYFLHELNYPMDLTAKHLAALEKTVSKLSNSEKFKIYGGKLAVLALEFAQQLSKPTAEQIDLLYKWASEQKDINQVDLQHVQKLYLKQIQVNGDSEKIKEFKREVATNILRQETHNLLSHPTGIFRYIQFLIGYVFVAWPLELILIFVSLVIFLVQSSIVLSHEEMKRASIAKKIWRVFKKAYLGGTNVPFFSKLAASLVLFGIGLYFNSAKNVVESLISNM